MPIITLKFKDSVIKEYLIETDVTLTIGRKNTNDIVIENLAVSGNHAKIDPVNDGYLLTDLKSKNGTFVNEKLITSHWLKQGDIVTIGKHNLCFEYQQGEEQVDDEAGSMDKTMVMDTDDHHKMLAKSDPEMASSVAGTSPVGMLCFLSGGQEEFKLTKKLTKIGKDDSSDIIIKGFLIGKTAVTISKRPNGYSLSYVGGIAKPKVNEKVVKDTIMLKEFDTIEIGSTKLQFVLST